MQTPQFLLDLLQLLFDLAVPAAFCTLAAAGVNLRHEGGVNFHVNGRTGKWILWTIVLLTLPQLLSWVAVLSAHEQGISSFAVEQIFRESWLDVVVRRSRAADSEWDPTDHHRFDYVDRASVRNVLNQLRDDLPEPRLPVSTSAAFEKLIAKIEAARTTDGSWFGKPPVPREEGERENAVVIDEIHHAIFHCEQEGVPEDVIESMLLRSWIRMLVFNEHEAERVFHILDKYWEQVHATFQIRMAGYSGLRVQ